MAMLFAVTLVGIPRGIWGEQGKFATGLIDVILGMALIHTIFFRSSVDRALKLPLALLIAWIVVRLFDVNTPGAIVAYYGARKTLYFFLAVLVGFNTRLPSYRRIALAILGILVLQCLFALHQRLAWSEFDMRLVASTSADIYTGLLGGERRAVGLFSSPFTLGMLGAVGVAIAPTFSAWGTRVASFALGACLVWLSMTRINLVAAPLAFLLVLSMRHRVSRRRLLPSASLVAVLLLCVLLAFGSELADLLRSESRFNGRFESYAFVVDQMLASPWRALLGFGVGSAGDTLGSFYIDAVHVTSHDLFVKILFETGLFGLFLYCWFVVAVFRVGSKSKTLPPEVVLGTFSILLINGLTGSAIESIPVSLLIGLFVGMGARLGLGTPVTSRRAVA